MAPYVSEGWAKRKNKLMKHNILLLTLALATAVGLGSCLSEDDKIKGSPECAITAFAINDIKTVFHTLASDGTDSTYSRTVGGNDVYFNIDQVKNKIESVDSIVAWADISRVITSVSAEGNVFCRQRGAELFYPFTSGKDSVDYTQKVEFLIISYDGNWSKTYEAKINKAKLDADSLYWNDTATPAITTGSSLHAVALDKNIFVFADGKAVKGTISNGQVAWGTPAAIETASGQDLDIESVTAHNGRLYALTTDGTLVGADPDNGGTQWSAASADKFTALLGSDGKSLYASDGNNILASTTLSVWNACGSDDLEHLPTAPVSMAAYASRTNSSIRNVVMLGPNTDETTPVWFKIAASEESNSQPWSYIQITSDNDYPLPAMQQAQMVRYDNALLAFGAPFDCIYRSDDNGISWHQTTAHIGLPKTLATAIKDNASAAISTVVADGSIWMISNTGHAWRGHIGSNQ